MWNDSRKQWPHCPAHRLVQREKANSPEPAGLVGDVINYANDSGRTAGYRSGREDRGKTSVCHTSKPKTATSKRSYLPISAWTSNGKGYADWRSPV